MSGLAYERREWSEQSVIEWNRLDGISRTHDRYLKMAFTKMVAQGKPDRALVEEKITDCVVETAVMTANSYGLVFDAAAPRYRKLVDDLTDSYMKVVENDNAKQKVKAILPSGLSLHDRQRRLDVFGLDARAAIRLERMRQKGRSENDLRLARLDMSLQRGNLVALTEINRVINATLEAVWLDNITEVQKARRKRVEYGGEWYAQAGDTARVVTSLRGLPARAVKSIVTRRDNRTCDYCEPLDGATAQLGEMFNTQYGLFKYPPFHPRCRCFMIVSY